ncbi:Ubiquitin-like protein [Xylographa trunciseda]|nr:Ubiquitin-like protein [Xylographa trunciseda]
MASRSSPSPPPPDDYPPSLPLPLSASLLLTSLPHDAHTALALAAQQDQHPQKIKVRFQPIGSAPALTQRVFKISATSRFESVVTFLRKKLGARREESVFCYINSVFAPGLDEGVGGLWKVSAWSEWVFGQGEARRGWVKDVDEGGWKSLGMRILILQVVGK